ncbi:lactate utilization protein C [Paraburkholderia sp. B3]|uniref:LutC/YkgG family protein n=1 Tax=Paraburkholderia sp. B3 TaxID=3134791 RepID=UPI0039829BF2
MASREAFIARVRAAQPAALDLPEVPLFGTPAGDLRERFVASLELMGGRAVQAASADAVLPLIHERFGPHVEIASAVPEVSGTVTLDAAMPPTWLERVDVGVVRARFGVAETGSVWLSEREYVVNALGYIVQHLVVLLDFAQIVGGLQDAYRRDDFRRARYAALVTGPSATADIEGVLIQGAQGVKSLTVVGLPAS